MSRTFLDAHVTKRHSDVSIESVSAAVAGRPMTAAVPSMTESTELDCIKRRLQQTEQRLMQESDARNEAEAQVLTTSSPTIISSSQPTISNKT